MENASPFRIWYAAGLGSKITKLKNKQATRSLRHVEEDRYQITTAGIIPSICLLHSLLSHASF